MPISPYEFDKIMTASEVGRGCILKFDDGQPISMLIPMAINMQESFTITFIGQRERNFYATAEMFAMTTRFC
jgi:hypothetical protein